MANYVDENWYLDMLELPDDNDDEDEDDYYCEYCEQCGDYHSDALWDDDEEDIDGDD